jgi:hypothetical protein
MVRNLAFYLFVYIPFGICVFFQAILLFALYSTAQVALLAKIVFPVLIILSFIFHFKHLKQNEN